MQASSTSGSDSTSSPSTPNVTIRGKTDIAWRYCVEEVDPAGSKRKKLTCIYCKKVFAGGGINRFKQHLVGIRGDAVSCNIAPEEVREQIRAQLDDFASRKRREQELIAQQNTFLTQQIDARLPPRPLDSDVVVQVSTTPSGSGVQVSTTPTSSGVQVPTIPSGGVQVQGGKKRKKTIGAYFVSRTEPGDQPTIKSVMQSQEATEKCDLAVSKWMIDASIPFNAANSIYFQHMVDAIAGYGAGYKAPSFHSLRGILLKKNVEEVRKYVDGFRASWKETECTIMADGWTDQCRRTLINFLVYSPKGTVFLKSIDASDASKTSDMLYGLFREVVQFVGAENVVHVVTDNAANYVAAGRKLEEEFKTLFWSPCAAHCINLILQDIGKLDEVCDIVTHASRITKYIYNHCFPLHLMRQFTGGREILRPAPTRFATNFIALQSILSQKDALRAMATSREWVTSSYAKEIKGKKFETDVLDSCFWKECVVIVKLTEPLVRVLRLVDGDDRPAMPYIYEAMHTARDEMLRRFQRRKKRVDPYIKILDDRWDRQLHKNLHAAGFWLNPQFQYNPNEGEKRRRTTSGLFDVIERFSYGNNALRSKLTSEVRLFRGAEGNFGRPSAVNDRYVMSPDEWWMNYGCDAPELQKLAIRVLSQTCSASGCERNWSIFEHVHSKKRNRLEHQRLNDLVYVHYNLRLQQKCLKGKNYDQINFEEFRANDTWILEDEPPNLTSSELEAFRIDMEACNIQDVPNDELNLQDDHNDENDDDEGIEGGRHFEDIFENAGGSTSNLVTNPWD